MTPRQQIESIYDCMCRQNELYTEWSKRHGISYNTMMILYALDRGVATQREIVEGWMIPKQTVNTVVQALKRQGLVCFLPGRDRKEKPVAFTEEGRRYAEETLQDLYRREERALADLGPARSQALVELNLAFTAAFADEVLHER